MVWFRAHRKQFARRPICPLSPKRKKKNYSEFAKKLIAQGNAYYAFDTAEELELKRKEIPNFQYNQQYRIGHGLRNSLSLMKNEVDYLLTKNTPYVIRLKVDGNQNIIVPDLIRGDVTFDTTQIDDKVLLKADGMPTYHLAVVVDDFLMKITHAFRGEEWLPSAPVHILLWKYLFGLDAMPLWAHLPLILKPDGNGKLSKRDGERLGFPVFAMNWKDPATGYLNIGFKEIGFLPEAFINLLAVLGWNDGTEQEIFTLPELIEKFSIEKIHKGGAKFDFEKAKWFNHEWIKKLDNNKLLPQVKNILQENNIPVKDDNYLAEIITLIKDRCHLLNDFVQQCSYFFKTPTLLDVDTVKPKWTDEKRDFFTAFSNKLDTLIDWNYQTLEDIFKELATEKGIKPGELQLPFRIMLVGGKYGLAVFQIAALIGKGETKMRIKNALQIFG